MNAIRRSAIVVMLAVMACHRDPSPADAATATATDAGPVAVVEASTPAPQTPEEKLETYRKHLSDLVDEKKYAEVCTGAPWFNKTICTWVANRADGKGVDRPNAQLYHSFFVEEHWTHAYGRLVGEVNSPPYEVVVGGYRNHCLLHTEDTKYSTTGAFDLWVQEQPEAEEVTTNSGATQHWVALDEMPLAKALMDLAHSGVSVESTARAKDAMTMIAEYKTYAERKGTLPTIPGDAAPTSSAVTTSSVSSQTPPIAATNKATLPTATPTATATTGTLDVGTTQAPSPSGGWCVVTIDGAPQGKTPLSGVQLTAGPHRVVCTGAGGKSEATTINIPAGGNARHNFNL